MGAPPKTRLVYVPIDVDIHEDDKICLSVSEHGIITENIYFRLMFKCYADKGYYYYFGDDEMLIFKLKFPEPIEINKLKEILSTFLKRDLFDKSIYEKYGILTSRGIQKRYLKIVLNNARKEVILDARYWLVEIPSSKIIKIINNTGNLINPPENEDNRSGNEENRTEKKQSKVNKIKEKEREGIVIPLSNPSFDFKIPTLDEITDYLTEKRYEINPELFYNHYKSNGWKVGGVQMMDWRATVDVWVNRQKEKANHMEPTSTAFSINNIKSVKSKAQQQLEGLAEGTVVLSNGNKFKKDSTPFLLTDSGAIPIGDFLKQFPNYEIIEQTKE